MTLERKDFYNLASYTGAGDMRDAGPEGASISSRSTAISFSSVKSEQEVTRCLKAADHKTVKLLQLKERVKS